MKATCIGLWLALSAGAAAAQQAKPLRIQPRPPVDSAHTTRVYGFRNGAFGLLGQTTARPEPGSYHTEPYALRVQVPAPHRDSAAVHRPGGRRERMSQQQLPAVRLVPGSGRRVQ